jgi:hypothetical protein
MSSVQQADYYTIYEYEKGYISAYVSFLVNQVAGMQFGWRNNSDWTKAK